MTGRHPHATLLVVDDQDAARFAKVQGLKRAGFQVFEAATGADALETAERVSPDLVLLDVNLPDINGLEVARRLRAANTSLPSLQIIQVSSTATGSADRVRGLEGGADVYLTEPLDPEVLVATIRALLRVRRVEALLGAALEGERAARQELEEASRLKDEFIATLSHELRTPLNAVMGWIFQLRHSTLDPETQARALDSLERNVRVQAQLINDLLDISRISKGKLQLQVQWVDLRSVVESAVESVRASMARKHIALHAELDSVFVAGDYARLQQIASNLLTNAVQFTPDDGAIHVATAGDGTRAVIRVQDTGAGIDRAFLPHVFDQFRQGAGGLSRKHGGLGLGLSVVRQLVELHGGSVNVNSEGAGRGASFTVELPVDRGLQVHPGRPLLAGLTLAVVGPATFVEEVAPILESSGASILRSPASDKNVSDLRAAAVHAVVHDPALHDRARAIADALACDTLVSTRLPVSPILLTLSVIRAMPVTRKAER